MAWVAGIGNNRAVGTNAWPRQFWLVVQGWSKGRAVQGLRSNYIPNSEIRLRSLSQRKGSFAAWVNVEQAKDWTKVS